jgi:hypothetical protein
MTENQRLHVKLHSYLYKQFRIALSAHRDGDHGYFSVSGKISEIDGVRAMNFFISSHRFRTAEDAYAAGKKNAETWVDQTDAG